MILMIDNYDSFTYNLVQYLGELGADLVVHRNDKITLDEIEALAPEKIVISPGPLHTAGGGHLLRSDPSVRWACAPSRRLLGASVYRRCVWRRCRPCRTLDARQNVADSPQWRADLR